MANEDLDDEWEADRRRKAEPPPSIDRDEFLAWRAPRVVTESPTSLDNPLWHWLVRTRHSGYGANQAMDGPSSCEAGPMWCFDRFGKSETPLRDGRVVHVGGEHEDFYDPDFFIYNDVTVIDPDGSIAIHGYARDAFLPRTFTAPRSSPTRSSSSAASGIRSSASWGSRLCSVSRSTRWPSSPSTRQVRRLAGSFGTLPNSRRMAAASSFAVGRSGSAMTAACRRTSMHGHWTFRVAAGRG